VASNYEEICKENRESYGTKGAQKSGKLAAGLYDDRTHFIFELLQNAEDALGRRVDWQGSSGVTFSLNSSRLVLSHFGKAFDEADVRSVCDIAESTKNESSIGRFGLGFKSVYTITDFPEIHSGLEDFAIENYVFPKRMDRSTREDEETQIILPLRPEDTNAARDIAAGFRQLGQGALLFLRNVNEINWSVDGGPSGFYLRNPPTVLDTNVRSIKVIGQEDDRPEVDQNWLVFHRDVFSLAGQKIGRVEIAFSLDATMDAPDQWTVQPLAKSPLVVFFPTVVETSLGFLVQGPYRTTPSRDNIPPADPWNQHLVQETCHLLVEAMRWLRDKRKLDVSVLRCLPVDRKKFLPGSRFAPLFDAVKQALRVEALLPAFDGSYAVADQAKLARTQELRELFNSEQVAKLFDLDVAAWLSGDITQDKAPDIRQYLMDELKVSEIRPEKLVPILAKPFLEEQSDEWILRLYEFLNGQGKTVRPLLDTVPLARLDDGTHVLSHDAGEAKVFLPCAIETGFPTVRKTVCATPEALAFLRSLRITEPDPVDDVVRNVLPKYRAAKVTVDDVEYAADIERISAAFKTDSAAQKDKLRVALCNTNFVMVVDTGDGQAYVAKPEETYIATERLQQLFAGVPDILIVDNEYDCLRGEDIRDLLVSCGASRYLVSEATESELVQTEKARIRKEAGLERASWESQPEDFTLRGLTLLLELLPTLKPHEAATRARVLWEALGDLEARGTAAFYGSYKWGYFHETKTARFDAVFVRLLNQVAWVPNGCGELVPARLVVFENLGWKTNPFLLAKIVFKPPSIDQLAKEAGIDPAALDFLRKHGLTNLADLTSRLGFVDAPSEPAPLPGPEAGKQPEADVYDNAKDLYGDDMPDIPPGTNDPDGGDHAASGTGRGGQGHLGNGAQRSGQNTGGARGGSGGHGVTNSQGNGATAGKRTPGAPGARPFISYIGAHPTEEEPDPDDLDQEVRMRIELHAINLIVGLEPALCRTPEGNPGFDLFEADAIGKQKRWVEVKSMTGSLKDRPVGLSRAQFDFAREKGDAYWLYVVEHATEPTQARILKIQNPAGQARTFTFDSGWVDIAHIERKG
jgi:hypothetical protein